MLFYIALQHHQQNNAQENSIIDAFIDCIRVKLRSTRKVCPDRKFLPGAASQLPPVLTTFAEPRLSCSTLPVGCFRGRNAKGTERGSGPAGRAE